MAPVATHETVCWVEEYEGATFSVMPYVCFLTEPSEPHYYFSGTVYIHTYNWEEKRKVMWKVEVKVNVRYTVIGHTATLPLLLPLVWWWNFYLSSFSSVKNCSSLWHEFDSVLLGRPIPGVWSSPPSGAKVKIGWNLISALPVWFLNTEATCSLFSTVLFLLFYSFFEWIVF
jgi:hypothetical protein